MKKRLVDVCENTGIKTYYTKERDDKFTLVQEQNLDSYAKNSIEMRKMQKNNDNSDRLLAVVPPLLIEQWSKELGDNCTKKKHSEFLKIKLNSPEFAAFKLTEGKI